MTETQEKPVKKLKSLKERQREAIVNKGKAVKPIGSRKMVNEDGLTAKEEEFCQLFASDREFFGNGHQSYIEAFDVTLYKGKKPTGKGNYMTYESMKLAVHKLLTNDNILRRIDQLFEADGLNDQFVDKQTLKLITQDAEFNVKVKAIAEYNKVKQRITDRLDVRFSRENMTDAELDRIIEEQDKFFKKK